MSQTSAIQKKKTNLFIVLSAIFLTNAIIAEIIGGKIFSLEGTLGLPPANIPLIGDFILNFDLTAGVVLWPVVFITTDIINEYFGKEGVKKISLLTIVMIAYGFLAIYLATSLTPAGFWLDLYPKDPEGNNFNIDYAFSSVFLQATRIIFASLVAFMVAQLLDVFIFHKLRKLTGRHMIWLRATGSTLISQLIDSYVVLFIAFYFLAPDDQRWTFGQVISVGVMNYIYKFFIAVVLTPLLYLAHYLIDGYLGKEASQEIMEEAAEKSKGFF